MMLSNTGVYALRALIYLARHEGEGPVRVDDISDALGVPRNYLSKVLHTLVKEGVLRSSRGPAGGYELAAPASLLTLARVVEPFDAIDEGRACLLGQGLCDPADPCALHDRWNDVALEVASFFRDTVLLDVVKDAGKAEVILGS